MITFPLIPDPLIECDSENIYYPSDDSYFLLDYFKNSVNNTFFDGMNINEIEYILDIQEYAQKHQSSLPHQKNYCQKAEPQK